MDSVCIYCFPDWRALQTIYCAEGNQVLINKIYPEGLHTKLLIGRGGLDGRRRRRVPLHHLTEGHIYAHTTHRSTQADVESLKTDLFV